MDEMHFGGERDTRREVNRFSRCRAKYSLNGKPEEWRKRLLFTRRFKIFSCRNVIRNRIHGTRSKPIISRRSNRINIFNSTDENIKRCNRSSLEVHRSIVTRPRVRHRSIFQTRLINSSHTSIKNRQQPSFETQVSSFRGAEAR